MISKETKSMIFGFIFLSLLVPLQAHAGMGRVFSIFEAILPLAILWVVFVAAWYLAVASVATRCGEAIGGVPPLRKALVVLLWVTVLSLTMIGPMGIFYLLLFFPVVTVKAFRPALAAQLSEPLSTALKRISVVSSLVLVVLIASSVYIHSHRSRADFLHMLNSSQVSQQIKADISV